MIFIFIASTLSEHKSRGQLQRGNYKMKLSKRTLLHVSILFFICLGFISSTLAVQPGWTKKQVTRELGKPDNIVTDHDLGETWTY